MKKLFKHIITPNSDLSSLFTTQLNFATFGDVLWYDVEELVEGDEMAEEMKELSKLDFQTICFFIDFNGPTYPTFALIAHVNSFDPLTLIQARKRPD